MATTTPYGIYYPIASDSVAPLHTAFSTLAVDVLLGQTDKLYVVVVLASNRVPAPIGILLLITESETKGRSRVKLVATAGVEFLVSVAFTVTILLEIVYLAEIANPVKLSTLNPTSATPVTLANTDVISLNFTYPLP